MMLKLPNERMINLAALMAYSAKSLEEATLNFTVITFIRLC